MRLACFDVFDTVITRAVSNPDAIFMLMANKLADSGLLPCTPEVFARLRSKAEIYARRQSEIGEVTLDDIYRHLLGYLPFAQSDLSQLRDLEIDIEVSMSRPIEQAIDHVKSARKAGFQVAFVSDMYLPKTVILRMLEQFGAYEAGDSLFVSNDYGKTKASGGLFEIVMKHHGTTKSHTSHFGNDAQSDVSSPRKLGIQARRFESCDPTRFEVILSNHTFSTSGLSALLGGASRLARLELARKTTIDPAIVDIAVGVAAPVLVSYVFWVLREAKKQGVKKLFFVSRDGQILLSIARELARKMGEEIELSYLYGSRQAWHLPAITHFTAENVSWLFDNTGVLTINMAIDRLRLDRDEATNLVIKAGMPLERFDENLVPNHVSILTQIFIEDQSLSSLVLRTAEHQRKMTKRYFQQEQLLGNTKCGIVDVGWYGRLKDSLDRIIEKDTHGFYIGLRRSTNPRISANNQAFLFDFREEQRFGYAPPGIDYAIELFCQANHGSVTGYNLCGQSVVPQCRSEKISYRQSWGVEDVHKAVDCFVKHLPNEFFYANSLSGIQPTLCELLEEFWVNPSIEVSEKWGKFPFQDDQSGQIESKLLHPLTLKDIFKDFVRGYTKAPGLIWPAASDAVTTTLNKRIQKFAMKARHFLHRLKITTKKYFA